MSSGSLGKLSNQPFPLAIWWDAGKARLKHLLRQHSQDQARSRRDRVCSIERNLADLLVREAQGNNVLQLIKEVKDKLELEHLHKAEGARVRAREQWAEEGETSSAYFFRQEKIRARRRLVTGIRNARGVIVRSIAAILRVWVLFYVNLLSASSPSLPDQTFFLTASIAFSPVKKRLFVGVKSLWRSDSRALNGINHLV